MAKYHTSSFGMLAAVMVVEVRPDANRLFSPVLSWIAK